MSGEQQDFNHLDRAGRATAGVACSPRFAVTLTVGVAIVLAWLLLGAMAIRGAEGSLAGRPGDLLLKNLPSLPLPDFLDRFFTLCLAPAPLASPAGLQVPALVLMWFLMAIATMLPSAAPLIRTYCEIADTARIKNEPVVHPLVLVTGYLTTWL
ncbi:MAG: DUF2182 domain-containing protein, partial [Mesorhizobium sp.]|uniref:copper chaperone n=1 Tax=Mesorhizobium sp. TaxID=1871066 RepID=UPI00122A4C4F